MSATFELFERWKEKKGYKSDREAAMHLGVSHGTPNQWKSGKNGEPEFIEKMAKDLDEDPIKTILQAYAEQKMGNSRKVLEKLSKRFGAVVLVVGMGATAYPVDAKSDESNLYIMRSRGRKGRYGKGSTHPRSNTRWTRKYHRTEDSMCRPAYA